MIHYISPYRSDKNIGKAINDAIKQLNANPENWICHCDMDVLWLRPDSKKQLEEILETTDFDILGPLTNRLSMNHQLMGGMFYEYDMCKHAECANVLNDANYGKVVQIQDILAAFCLCFRVSTWQKLGGFYENSLQFDSLFSIDARRDKMKIGIMTGIYVFHAYRLLSDNPKQDIAHLI